MDKRLRWAAIGLEAGTRRLLEDLERVKNGIDPAHVAKVKRVQVHVDGVRHVLSTMARIKELVVPRLEVLFHLTFKTPELLFLALARPALRTTFNNLAAFLHSKEGCTIESGEIENLGRYAHFGDVLALVGDKVIDLAIIETTWGAPAITSGAVTVAKASLVSNKNLARLCEQLAIDQFMLDGTRQPPASKVNAKRETRDRELGTLVEAIFGVIYEEFGLHEVMRLVPHLQYA